MAQLAAAFPALASLFSDVAPAAAAGAGAAAAPSAASALDLAGAGSAIQDVMSSGALPDFSSLLPGVEGGNQILAAMGTNLSAEGGGLSGFLQNLATYLPSAKTMKSIGDIGGSLSDLAQATKAPQPAPMTPTPSRPGSPVSLSIPQLIAPMPIGVPSGLQQLLSSIAQRGSNLSSAL